MKRYIKTYFITFGLALILSLLISSFIFFEELFSFKFLLSLIIAFVLSFGYVIFLSFSENKILNKFDIKSLSYNILLTVNMIITSSILYKIATILVDNGYIYFSLFDHEEDVKIVFIFILSIMNIISYLIFKLIKFSIDRYKKTKKIILFVFSIIVYILFVLSIIFWVSQGIIFLI